MQEELSILIQSQYPLIYLVTSEEDRAEQEIMAIAAQERFQRRVFSWTLTRGMVEYSAAGSAPQPQTTPPQPALDFAVRQRDPGLFIFKDLHPFLKDGGNAEVVRCLRDAVASFKGTDKTLILISPVQAIPIELEKEVVVLDFALPTMAQINDVLSAQLAQGHSDKLSTEAREKLLKAALGLTRDEAQKVYRKASVTAGRLTEQEVDIVLS